MTTIKEGVREFSITISIGKPINSINLPQEQFADTVVINGETYTKKVEEPRSFVWEIRYHSPEEVGAVRTERWAATKTRTKAEAIWHFTIGRPTGIRFNVEPIDDSEPGLTCFISAKEYPEAQ